MSLLPLVVLMLACLCVAQKKSVNDVGHTGWVDTVAFSPDGKIIASGSSDQTLKLWDAASGKLLRTIKVYPRGGGLVESVAFAPDGESVVAVSQYKLLQQWDVATGARRRLFDGYVCGLRCSSAPFSPDGKTIAGGDGDAGTVKIWDVDSGRVLRTFEKPRDEKSPRFPQNAEHILFSPDGSRLFADSGSSGLIQVWEVATGRELLRMETKAEISSMALSTDGRLLLIGGLSYDAPRTKGGLVALLDAETGREVRRFPGQWGKVNVVAFAPDGKLAASAGYAPSDGDGFDVIKLWDVSKGREVRQLRGHAEAIRAIDFAPDGQTLVSGSQDGTLKLWDVATGATLRSFPATARKKASSAAARKSSRTRRLLSARFKTRLMPSLRLCAFA